MQQMPTEGRKFKTVDTTWRKTMEKLATTAEVLIVGADEAGPARCRSPRHPTHFEPSLPETNGIL